MVQFLQTPTFTQVEGESGTIQLISSPTQEAELLQTALAFVPVEGTQTRISNDPENILELREDGLFAATKFLINDW